MSSSAITGPVLSDVRRAPAGTAAAPSFAFNDSTGTGVYLVSAGVLGLSTNGVQRVVVDASGNVGINVASPAAKLDVSRGSSGVVAKFTGTASAYIYAGGDVYFSSDASANNAFGASPSNYLNFYTNGSERMRLDASGNLLVGISSAQSTHTIVKGTSENDWVLNVSGANGGSTQFYSGNGTAYSGAAACQKVNRNTTSLRSLNAAGTINASGADYAEYMTKAGEFAIAKGDLCGVNAEGKLTNVFSEAVAFVVKSTNPSYVGGDSWGASFEDDAEGLEAARQKVDRIAFCGQVPVNVLGATPGQWIIPVEENGAIKGQAVSNPSFEQYQLAVGKVIAVEEDGRARIIVKIA